jgi:hypothetical protein
MSILHIDICFHINLEYSEVIYLAKAETEWMYIIKYLIHFNSVYKSLQNYSDLFSTAPVYSFIRHS